MAGLMAVTAFLSMWINNSAATSIMLPVALAITNELESHSKNYQKRNKIMKNDQAEGVTGMLNHSFSIDTLDLTRGDSAGELNQEEVILEALHLEKPFVFFLCSIRRTKKTIQFLIFSEPVVPIVLKKRFRLPWENPSQIKDELTHEKKYEDIRKGFLLAVAYSATIGGLSSLVGTAPNIFVKGFTDR